MKVKIKFFFRMSPRNIIEMIEMKEKLKLMGKNREKWHRKTRKH